MKLNFNYLFTLLFFSCLYTNFATSSHKLEDDISKQFRSAIRKGSLPEFEFYINRADINAPDSYNVTPLLEALFTDNLEIAKKLLERPDINVNKETNVKINDELTLSLTPLKAILIAIALASEQGNLDEVKNYEVIKELLKKKGARLGTQKSAKADVFEFPE